MSPAESEIRSIRPEDHDSVIQLLKSSLVLDDLTEELISFRIFEDPDFNSELCLVSSVAGKLVSIVCATIPTRFPESDIESIQRVAWIKVFATEESFRKKGIQTTLFERLLELLRARSVIEIRFSDRGNWHFWPGIDVRYEDGLDFLEKREFVKDLEEVDYLYDLSRFQYPRRILRLKENLIQSEVHLGEAKPSEKVELLNWISKQFSPFWSNETEFAFGRNFPSVFIARENEGKILGFATINGVAPGRFGPTGVDPNERGRGVGKVLLFDAFQALKDQEFEKATVHWTDLLSFYAQVPGMCGIRDYWIMSRRL